MENNELQRDSLGVLQRQSSPSDGGHFSSVIGKLLARLSGIYGDPWGRDEDQLRQMKRDWTEVLAGCTDGELHEAATAWIRTQDKWPKPSNIRQLVIDGRPRRELRPHRAEPYREPSPTAKARVRRMMEIVDRHKKVSETPFSDAMADPEYQAVLDEYTRETGRQPA